MALARATGLDINSVVEVISKGAAQSWQMENRYKTMLESKFDFGFAVDWMRKDLGICLNEARRAGVTLPLTALVDQFYAEVQQMGGNRWDTSSLIARLEALLADEGLRYELIRTELLEIKERFGDERKTEITYLDNEVSIKDLIKEEDVVITISHLGYIKRTPASEFRAQRRGGRGVQGGKTREEDYIEHLFVASTHHTMLFFTEKGRVYWLNVYQIPDGEKTSKGRAIQNMIQIAPDDKVRAIIDVKDFADKDYVNGHNIVLCTKKGIIKKTSAGRFQPSTSNRCERYHHQ